LILPRLVISNKSIFITNKYLPEGKVLVTKFEFGPSLGLSLRGNCDELENTLKLKLLVTFGMNLEGFCFELDI
jgi:hypothetical protein